MQDNAPKKRLLDITPQVAEFVGSLQLKQFKQVWVKIIRLQENCRPHDSIKLHGDQKQDYYRTDISEYRVIYRFDESIIYVAYAGKRNDDEAYKKFERKP